ncbi:hypothetical protein L9F63_002390, partial [Diploptera punctata]
LRFRSSPSAVKTIHGIAFRLFSHSNFSFEYSVSLSNIWSFHCWLIYETMIYYCGHKVTPPS